MVNQGRYHDTRVFCRWKGDQVQRLLSAKENNWAAAARLLHLVCY
jgi:hypothetical protein